MTAAQIAAVKGCLAVGSRRARTAERRDCVGGHDTGNHRPCKLRAMAAGHFPEAGRGYENCMGDAGRVMSIAAPN